MFYFQKFYLRFVIQIIYFYLPNLSSSSSFTTKIFLVTNHLKRILETDWFSNKFSEFYFPHDFHLSKCLAFYLFLSNKHIYKSYISVTCNPSNSHLFALLAIFSLFLSLSTPKLFFRFHLSAETFDSIR